MTIPSLGGEHVGDQRPRSTGIGGEHAGQDGHRERVAFGDLDADEAQQPPGIIGQQPRRVRAEQIYGPAGQSGGQPGSEQRHNQVIDRTGRQERRVEPPGAGGADLRQIGERCERDVLRAADTCFGQGGSQRRAEAVPQTGIAEGSENPITRLRGDAQRTSSG